MSKMYSYRFTWNELTFFLFAKKKCPDCGGKIERFYKQAYVGKGNSDFGYLISGGEDNYRRKIYYKCINCNKEYSLDELIIQTYQRQKEEKAMRKDKK